VFASALSSFQGILQCYVSYDIACQWFPNLRTREENDWPLHLQILKGIDIIPMIPAFHYPAHGGKGHDEFDTRLVVGNGTSDNEAPERIWGPHNALGNTTKSMGPETRHMVLDDAIGHWNWWKYVQHGMFLQLSSSGIALIVRLGNSLRKSYKAAISNRNLQVEAHRGFSEGIPKGLRAEWELKCQRWEESPYPKIKHATNPYEQADLCKLHPP
jgi:hypothetical protein